MSILVGPPRYCGHSTTLGLTLPVQGWPLAEDWWSVIPNPFCPRWCSLRLREHMVRTLLHPSPTGMIKHRWCTNPTSFPIYEWGEGWHEMNESEYEMTWSRDLKEWNVGEIKTGKGENPEKTPTLPTVSTTTVPLATRDLKLLARSSYPIVALNLCISVCRGSFHVILKSVNIPHKW